MDIKLQRSDLLKVLNTAIKAVPSKATNPILENFLFSAAGGVLSVIATDTNITIGSRCPVEGGGADCLPAAKLTELARVLPDGEVSIKTENNIATISWGNGHSEIPTSDIKLFPQVANFTKPTAKVKAAELVNALKHTIVCVANDDLRPVLGGIYFDTNDNGFNLASSDSRMLMVVPVSKEGEVSRSFIVPAVAAKCIMDAADCEDVELAVDENSAHFKCGDTVISSRTIVGTFPKYAQVFPTNNGNILSAGKGAIVSAIRRVSTCANKASNQIKLSLDPLGQITVAAQDLGFGVAAKEDIDDTTYDGVAMSIGFRSDLLQKLIGSLDADNITLAFGTPKGAALISGEGDNSKAILMPIQIQ